MTSTATSGHLSVCRESVVFNLCGLCLNVSGRLWAYIINGYVVQQHVLVYFTVSFYIVQYPVLRTAQSILNFTAWKTCSIKHYFNFSGKHSVIL